MSTPIKVYSQNQTRVTVTSKTKPAKVSLSYGSGGGGGATNLNQLSDVVISNPANNQVLMYNSNTTKFTNQNVNISIIDDGSF